MLWNKLLGAGGQGGAAPTITLSGYANEVSNSSPLDISGIPINSGDIIIYWQAKDTASIPGPPSVAGYTEIWSHTGGTGGSMRAIRKSGRILVGQAAVALTSQSIERRTAPKLAFPTPTILLILV